METTVQSDAPATTRPKRRRTHRCEETFHAVAEQRFQHLEAQVQEIKSRVNGLIFVVLGAVTAQLLLKLVG